MKEIRVDPNQSDCPYCKSDNVVEISYGILHKLSEEEEKLVKNGKLVFRGCVVRFF